MTEEYSTLNIRCNRCGGEIKYTICCIDNKVYCSSCAEKIRQENYLNALSNLGWVCPRCGRSNSPFVSQCPCSQQVTIGSSPSYWIGR